MMFKFRKHQELLANLLNDSRIETRRQIVAHVCPGGGKSVLPVIAAHKLIKRGIIEKVVIFVPRLTLKRQGAQAFVDPNFRSALGHKLTINEPESAGIPNPCQETNGFITTYQSLENNKAMFEHYFKKYKTLLVLDEAHHIGEETKTHRDLKTIYKLAAFRLIMTGTLDRNNGDKIAFLDYARPDPGCTLKPDVDIYYGLGDAMAEKAIVPTHFFLADGPVEYLDKASERVYQPSLEQSGDDARDALAAALGTDFAYQVLDACVRDWAAWRVKNHRSLMLVVCKDIDQAKKIKKHMEQFLFSCGIATSEESGAAQEVIRTFKFNGNPQVLVTVAMAYEGLDVRQITHIACLTHYRSTSWLIQMFNRATRFDPEAGPWENQRAFIYAPNDPLIRDVIEIMQKEGVVGVVENIREDGEIECGNYNSSDESGWIVPINGKVASITAESFDDCVKITDRERRRLEEIKSSHNLPFSIIDIAKTLRACGHEIPTTDDNLPPVQLEPKTPKEEADALREKIQDLCNKLNAIQNKPEWHWNSHLKQIFGTRQDLSLEKLKQQWRYLNTCYSEVADGLS